MKAVVLKPIMWSTNGYIEPSGYPSSSGYSSDYGFGHEEWNNKSNRYWRGFKLFHTESTDKLLEYSENGELGILMVASNNKNQYAIGIGTSVYHNTDEESELIAKELDTYDEWEQVWSLDLVKSKYGYDKNKFLEHWNKDYKWLRWKCPKNQYFHFERPLLLDPKKISGKNRIIAMHGRFQAVYPEQIIAIIKDHIPEESPILSWLSEPDFDESIISIDLKKFKQNQKRWPKRKIISGGNSPAAKKFRYWVEGVRSVEPYHAKLQSQFIQFLNSNNIQFKENKNYIDVQYRKNGKKFFAEIKPTDNVETKYAIRAAIGQLFEYQYKWGKDAILEIVIGKKPSNDEIEFVKSLGIWISYYDSNKKTFRQERPR